MGGWRAVARSVVEVAFTSGLPAINEALCLRPAGGRSPRSRPSRRPSTVRAIAMAPTEGLARGMAVERTGEPITVPVGPATLGRLFNVLGEPLDGREPLDRSRALADPPRGPVARRPASRRRVPGNRDQGHRPAGPAAARRQGRPDRRGGGRQDRAPPGVHPERESRSRRGCRSLPASASAPARGTTSGTKCRRRACSPTPILALRPDERPAGEPLPGGPGGPDDGRVFPRRARAPR